MTTLETIAKLRDDAKWYYDMSCQDKPLYASRNQYQAASKHAYAAARAMYQAYLMVGV